MEIIEDGNLVDRVRILLQRDMQYYEGMQTVLLEAVCVRVSGGKLDFPRHASFAAIKIVTWWEAEFFAAFRSQSGLSMTDEDDSRRGTEEDDAIKKTLPSEFILLIIDTSEQLLEHLHTLIQESLDHADLTVLTATLGAAALIRNCLWCYNQQSKGKISIQSSSRLFGCYQSYNEMAEAVAERLLDLHCRLISLYILNEADSLSWQKKNLFFEKERCSFTTQMWWLYMQGCKADLWNTVPPKMAQRVFAGMLNESLSIIVTRFIHGRPSFARSEQFWADAFNVLCCSACLTLSASVDSDELLGLRSHKISMGMRDIHAKCSELIACLLLRGVPLRVLFQACRNGLESTMIQLQQCGPVPWLLICAPKLLGSQISRHSWWMKPLPVKSQLIIELNVLKGQPHPSWTQLLKVFSMDDCTVARMLMSTLVRQCVGYTKSVSSLATVDKQSVPEKTDGCGGFLCSGSECDRLASDADENYPLSLCLYSIAYISANTFMDPLFGTIPALEKDTNWSNYLDKQQIWNQARPPWLNALLAALRPIATPIVETLLDAVQMGASIYQAMSLLLACLMELCVCAPVRVLSTGYALNGNLPAYSHPLGGSVLLHIFCASLYSALLRFSTFDQAEKKSKVQNRRMQKTTGVSDEVNGFNTQDFSASAIALAEAICSIDENNKHTDEINVLLTLIQDWIDSQQSNDCNAELEKMPAYIETYSDGLLFNYIGRRSLKVAHEYLIRTSDWVLKNLEQEIRNVQDDCVNLNKITVAVKPLTFVMFHINETTFDQFLIDFNESYWQSVLKTPMTGTVERTRSQILLRPEFKNLEELTADEREVIKSMKELCSVERPIHFR